MIGKMREKITIQKKTVQTDELGGITETWADYKTVWAKVEEVKADLRIIAERGNMKRTFRITIRNRDDIDENDRIIYRGMTLKIVGIRVTDTQRRYLEITAEAEE